MTTAVATQLSTLSNLIFRQCNGDAEKLAYQCAVFLTGEVEELIEEYIWEYTNDFQEALEDEGSDD